MRPILLPLAALVLLPACDNAAQPSQAEAELSPVAANQEALTDERRVLDLEGGVNFRGLGGYRTADGRITKWETVYRSGSPAGLTKADNDELARRGIRTFCDFRSTEERASEPNPYVAENSDVEYWTRDYALNAGDLMHVLGGPDASAEKSREAMTGLYRTIAQDNAESYAQMFRYLAEARTPLAFNCSAGKDRAGTGAALLLTLLGVPRETVVADYALSDDLVDYRAQMQETADSNPSYSALAQLPWETVEPLVASDPAYIESAFSALEDEYGSVDAFIEQELGVTKDMKRAIVENLTEEA
ncbi:tyrosine-protein phosphatase [Altericroceibacterium endophyticum]|uniref:Protein-tyrosine-phosphatase n=1 Tax=Altericroceibacterium endophyticum TaxID=1808508 RepID=A0A6I4T4U2_9SPHN|nr:tyrosine-protein phosphatase [Altericroceibacterium endophyticum]MXO65906.1 protein-tyrosine-phosphatase [Altericroceibacterium endophyticum]